MSRVWFATSFETADQASWRPEVEGTAGVRCRADQGEVTLRPVLQEEEKQPAFQNYLDRVTDRPDRRLATGLLDTGYGLSHPSGGTQKPGEFSCLQEHTFIYS